MHRPSTTEQNFPLPFARRLTQSAVLLAALVAGAACGDDPAGTPPGNTGRDGEPGPTHDSPSNGNGPDAGRDSAPVTDPLVDAPSQPSEANPQPEASTVDASKTDEGVPNVTPDTGTPDAATSDAGSPSDAASASDGARPGWRLVWRDEFDGPRGTPPDSTKWTPQVGLNGANAELEFYNARPQNLSMDGTGNLVITALRESYMGAGYTSARIESGGKFEQMYGRFESRLRLPRGQGLWPAFWVMGNNAPVGWPARGEIDIMENVGRDPPTNVGALHGPGYSGSLDFRATYMLAGGYSTDFHVFAIEWEPNVIRWYVDDNLYETRTPADLAARGGNLQWVYDHPFFIIFNVAVGGRFPGNPDATTPFPQSLFIDYVRVYAR